MKSEMSRGRGRPKGNSVLFARRVSPEMAARLRDVLNGVINPAPEIVLENVMTPLPEEPVESASVVQVKALLDNVESLTLQVKALEHALGEALEADLDEKAAYWRMRALKAEQSNLKGEFDQT